MKEEIILLAESCTAGQFCEMNYKLWVGSMIFISGKRSSLKFLRKSVLN